jgi:N6-L-threonylcarbamoyladenine synthase
MSDHGQFNYLGSTKDDAAGECFDKCGRLLGLPYPYGPYIDELASKFDPIKSSFKLRLPRPLIHSKTLDLSFSGLKTAFLYLYQEQEAKTEITDAFKEALAFELQEAITDVLMAKFSQAALLNKVSSLILCGGVAANKRLRHKLQVFGEKNNIPVFVPAIKLCTDNAAYIASAAYYNQSTMPWSSVNTNPALSIASPII